MEKKYSNLNHSNLHEIKVSVRGMHIIITPGCFGCISEQRSCVHFFLCPDIQEFPLFLVYL